MIDTHCHLDIHDGEDALDVSTALAQAAEVGVTRIVQIGVDVPSSRWSADVAARHEHVRAGIALHPNEAPRLAATGTLQQAYAAIEELAVAPDVVAIGETGLDHYRTEPAGNAVQEESFRWHIDLARRCDKVLVIHDRDAHDDVLRVLHDSDLPDRVVFHCFSGDATMARHCAEQGWYVSFAGVVTFKNADGLRAALAEVPVDRVLVETDAPYLTPVPHRGRLNASYLVPLTVRAMAEVRGLDEDTMAQTLWDNSIRVFGAW